MRAQTALTLVGKFDPLVSLPRSRGLESRCRVRTIVRRRPSILVVVPPLVLIFGRRQVPTPIREVQSFMVCLQRVTSVFMARVPILGTASATDL